MGDDGSGRGRYFNMMSLWIAQASAAAETPNAGDGSGWLIDPELVDPGYGQTMADGGIQTSFPAPPPRPEQPQWDLGWLRDFFESTAPALKPLLWIGAAALLLLILYHFVPAFADWVDNLRFGRKRNDEAAEESIGEAEAGAARARLADAAREAGFRRIGIASDARPASLLRAAADAFG